MWKKLANAIANAGHKRVVVFAGPVAKVELARFQIGSIAQSNRTERSVADVGNLLPLRDAFLEP